MTPREFWASLVKKADQPIDATSALAGDATLTGLWPFVSLSEPQSKWSSDAVRGAVAVALERNYDDEADWPAALALLIAPYPERPETLLDLLSLAHRVLAKAATEPHRRFLGRAATLFVGHALRSDPLVSFEAANTLGGLPQRALLFGSVAEKNALLLTFGHLQSSLNDDGLAGFMAERAKPAMAAPTGWSTTPADVDSLHARLASSFAQYARSDEALRSPLAHLGATLRTFAESQCSEPSVLGAGAIRVRGRSEPEASAGALASIQAFVDSLAAYVGNLVAEPMMLTRGSVEMVFRFNAVDNVDDAPTPSLTAAAEMIEKLLDPASADRIPAAVSVLFDLVWRHDLDVDLMLRMRNGDVRTVHLSRGKVNPMREDDRVRRKEPDVESLDVPQADDLDKVFKVAELLFAGEDVTVTALGLTAPRQIGYYRHAARILGLVEQFGGITPSGLQIAALTSRSERMQRVSVFFEQSAVGRAWLDWAGVDVASALDPTTAGKFLEERTKVGGSTRGRRAGTLQRWLAAFRQPP